MDDPGSALRLLTLATSGARVLVAVVVGYGLLAFFAQRAVAFPGQFRTVSSDRIAPGTTRVWLETSFGRVEAWMFMPTAPDTASGQAATETRSATDVPPPPWPAVIFAHGNGELIDDWGSEMRSLADLGLVTLAVEFPGYGRSEGHPKRSTVRETFTRAYDMLARHPSVDPNGIVAYGRSMGGGAASDLALDRPAVAALVLQSTFSSTMAMARAVFVPGLLVRDRFDPRRAVAAYAGPVLLMHGPSDEVIPYAHALAIAQARSGLEVVDLPCGHNDCGPHWSWIRAGIERFLGEEGILR